MDQMKQDPETRPLLVKSPVELLAGTQKPVQINTAVATGGPTCRQTRSKAFIVGVIALMLTGVLMMPSIIGYIVAEHQANHAAPSKLDSNDFVGGDVGQSSLEAERRHSINLDLSREKYGRSSAVHALNAGGGPHDDHHGILGREGDSTIATGGASQARGGEGRDYVISEEVDVINEGSTGGDGETTVVTVREPLIKRQDVAGNKELPPNVPRVHKERSPSAVNYRARGSGEEMSSKPNVFFVMIDDMGWGDMGYQSTDLSRLTPNLDRLAAGGIKVRGGPTLKTHKPRTVITRQEWRISISWVCSIDYQSW